MRGAPVRPEEARSLGETALSFAWVTPLVFVMAHIGLGFIAVQERNAEAARVHYDALGQHNILLWFTYVSMDRIRGLLARTIGWREVALKHFEDAIAHCEAAGFRSELAWSCYDCAETLLDSGRPDARATVLLERTLTIARELGMRPLMERVLARREFLSA